MAERTQRAEPRARGGSDRHSDRIRRDIERTRYAMDQTIDALERRLGPRGLTDRVVRSVRSDGGGGVRRELERQVRDHPVPLALMGLGLGWLAVEQAFGSGSPGGSRGPSEGGARETAEGAARSARDAAESAEELGKKATERARDRVQSARSAVSSAARGIGAGGDSAVRRFREMLDESPLAVGAVTFGIGLAAGLAAPSSRWEDETLGEASESLKEEAYETAAEQARERVEGQGDFEPDDADTPAAGGRPSEEHRAGTESEGPSEGEGLAR